jgi:hypothetical protein
MTIVIEPSDILSHLLSHGIEVILFEVSVGATVNQIE